MSIERPHGAGERPAVRDSGSTDHGTHDELLVTRFVAGDVTAAEAEQARGLIAGCPTCSLLAADLAAISQAMADLPQPRRTRDFRLSDTGAAALTPGGFRGLLSRLGLGADSRRPGWLRALQPAAGALVAVGLVMAIVTSPAGQLATGGASTSRETALSAGGSPAGAPALAAVPAAASPARPAAPRVEALPAASAGTASALGAGSSAAPGAGSVAAPAATAGPAVNAPPSPAGPAVNLAAPAASPPGPPLPVATPPGPPLPVASPPGREPLFGTGACGSGSGASGPEAPCAGSSAAPVAQAVPPALPGPSAKSVAAVAGTPGRQAVGVVTIQAWQAWLVLAAAAALALVAIRLALRRTA